MMGDGIRTYGPGKFHAIIDSYAYQVTLDGGADEEESYPDAGGWYGLLWLDEDTREAVLHKVPHDDELTGDEEDLLRDSAAVIFYERSDGIVEADWFDDKKDAEEAWAEIQEEFEEEGAEEHVVVEEQPDDEDEADDRDDKRTITLYDDEALKLIPNWWSSQGDPLYAIYSMGGQHEAWVFQRAISNLDSDLSSVRKLGRDRYQLGKGTFKKAEIDELRTIRDALEMALAGGD